MSKRAALADMLRERQTPKGLATHAREFQQAAELIESAVGLDEFKGALKDSRYHNPFYYLCGHAIELAMKSLLLKAGHSHEELMKLGHDLEKCLEAAKSDYPQTAKTFDEHANVIALLNASYATKEFEYRITGAKRWPSPSPLLYVVDDFCGLADESKAEPMP